MSTVKTIRTRVKNELQLFFPPAYFEIELYMDPKVVDNSPSATVYFKPIQFREFDFDTAMFQRLMEFRFFHGLRFDTWRFGWNAERGVALQLNFK